MYAVIEDSGQQFRVSEGDVLDVDTRDLAENAKELTFERILLVSGEKVVTVGTPLVKGASVTAEILDPLHKGKKIHIYYWRRRKSSKKKIGHRQKYLRVRVTGIKG